MYTIFILSLLLLVGFGVDMLFNALEALRHLAEQASRQSVNTDDLRLSLENIARSAFLFLSVGIVMFSALMFGLIYRIVPALERLSSGIATIRSRKHSSYRLSLPVKSELGDIATALNDLLDEVSRSQDELRAEETKFVASINSLPLGYVLLDANGDQVMVNPRFKELVQSKNSDESEKAYVAELLKKCQTAAQHVNEPKVFETSHPDGRNFRLYVSALRSRGDYRGAVLLLDDITEAKLLDRSKDEFFSIASHELRTPLSAIRGNVAMIRELHSETLAPEVSGMLDDVYASSVKLIGIVNDFLDMSSLEQGKMKFTIGVFDIVQVAKELEHEMKGISKEHKVPIRFIPDDLTVLNVIGDPVRTKQVMFNLVGNALKFTTSGSIELRLHPQKDRVRVDVTDTGRGISNEGQHLLFRKFQQTGESLYTRDTAGGTGLGLYISKLLVEKMGGDIMLTRSTVGKGSTFSFTMLRSK